MPDQQLIINGKRIPWSFYQMVRSLVGDHDRTLQVLYNARKADNPIAYIKRGLLPPDRYILKTPVELEQPGGMEKIQKWYDSCRRGQTKIGRNVMSLGEILKEAITEPNQRPV